MASRVTVDGPSDRQRRGASRPTIVLGLACIGGFLGTIAGGLIGFHATGMEFPDHADLLPFCMLFGAGIGWLSGVALGSAVGADARSPSRVGRWLVFVGAMVVLIAAFTIVSLPVPSGWPERGVALFSFWRASAEGTMAGVAVVVDAVIALATLWWVSRERRGDGSGSPGPFAGAVGIAGLFLGGLTFAFVVWFVAANWSSTMDHQKYRVVYKTTNSLANAASRRLDRTGSFPANLDEALAAGGTVQPGSVVDFAGVVNGSFCVRVGVDDEGGSGDPHYYALVHRRPKGSHAWISVESGQGTSCASQEH